VTRGLTGTWGVRARSPRLRAGAAYVVMLALAVPIGACKRGHASPTTDPQPAALTVRDTSDAFLFTWIDDKGDFHVETRVADVPIMGRDAVRVVDPGKDDGSRADRVVVADLRQTRADGTYVVRTMARSDFEAIALARREKSGPTLANATPPPSSSAADPAGAPPAAGGEAHASRAVVIVYGAEWCGACHEATRYLRRKGIAYVEKDVEKDPSAEREMQEKLARNGLRAGSIPVLDVRGKVMIGFSPSEVDAALGQAL
jgi:glutaredoxin